LAKQARYADARQAAIARRDLWSDDAALLLSAAEQLASISQQARSGGPKAEKADSEPAEAAAKAAVETLQTALAMGLEAARLNSPTLAPLSSRLDFQALRRSASIAEQPTRNLAGE
jgi:eukaryotic-like serine/threonine-protein kinase